MNKRIKRDLESGVEYILPDYMGDIKKVLLHRAECTPCDFYISDNSLEVNGGVEYVVIYADSENKLGSINLSSDLSLCVPVSADGYSGAEVFANVENISLRVTGPRKLSIKSNVSVCVSVTEEEGIEVSGDASEEEKNIERSIAVINVESNRYIENRIERELAEEVERIPGLSGEDIEIIGSGGTVKIEEARATDTGVEIKGEVIITAIVKTPNQPPFRIIKSLPFTELVEVNVEDGEQISPTAFISSLSFGENDDGDDKVVVANIILELDLTLKRNTQASVVKDAYLLNHECENTYSELEYTSLFGVQNERCYIDTTVDKGELGGEGIHNILSSWADIRDISVQNEDGVAKILANVCFSGIACEINADDSVSYYSIKKTVPFEKNVNISCLNNGNIYILPRVMNKYADAFIDGDKISLECHFDINLSVLERGKIKHLTSSNIIGDIPPRTSSTITVYYPSIDDTLFDIAKRYHTTIARLCEDNSLSASVSLDDSSCLENVKKIIIK